ncbi:retinol-binding protein pinta-like [Adelges cooleyi]|uniref:retinol-binding protein pinta-like n=1 Tax=Adelges cooleyi TaxID=133065 RepID=UPI00217FBDDF|nr:retinol-binding protein pinta-like [Adelges cooleyi]
METKTLILPSPSTIKQIYSKFDTTDEKMDLDVKILKEWMRKQPHLPNPDDDEKIIDEKRIKMVLLMCKNSLEKTKVKLDQHYTIKLSVPEWFSNWDPTSPELVQSIKLNCFVPLPKPTHEGHRVSVFYRSTQDTNNFVTDDYTKLSYMTYDLRTAKLDTWVKDIYIIDCNNTTMNHVTPALPIVKKYMESSFAAFPVRLHEIHVINIKSFLTPFISLPLSFMKKKIADKVFVHKSIEELKNFIDPSILPLNYGGTYPKTIEEIIDDWGDELIKHREWFMTQSSIVADNSKRPKNSNNQLDYFENSIEGSFRKLEVD